MKRAVLSPNLASIFGRRPTIVTGSSAIRLAWHLLAGGEGAAPASASNISPVMPMIALPILRAHYGKIGNQTASANVRVWLRASSLGQLLLRVDRLAPLAQFEVQLGPVDPMEELPK